MTYMRSTEYPNCLSVEVTAQIKGGLGSHEYHLTHRAKKSSWNDGFFTAPSSRQ